jgi:hypothetical protein
MNDLEIIKRAQQAGHKSAAELQQLGVAALTAEESRQLKGLRAFLERYSTPGAVRVASDADRQRLTVILEAHGPRHIKSFESRCYHMCRALTSQLQPPRSRGWLESTMRGVAW